MKHFGIYLLYSIIIYTLLCGCATKRTSTTSYKVVEVHDTLRQEVEKHDSIFVRDSVRVWMKNDTIYHDRWRTEYRDRWRDKVREVYVERNDTIIQRDTIQIERHQTPWAKFKERTGGYVIFFLLVAFFALLIRKK